MTPNQIGYKLPPAYIDLLQAQNGGYIRFEGLNGLNHVLYGIGPYFPNLMENDWSVYDGYVTIELQGLVPFDGDGHWHICLDYRKNRDEPGVTWIKSVYQEVALPWRSRIYEPIGIFEAI